MPALPLSGVRVLDLSRHLPGPYVTAALADLGATVVKIEEKDFGDPTRGMAPAVKDGTDSAIHAWLNRGKKSVALDLKSKEGLAIVKSMAAKSDVLVESFRPGVMKRLGLDYRHLKRLAPKLLFVSLSGYGANGPRSRRATHDLNAAGEAGLLTGGASISPGLVADTAAGLLTLVAILAKLKDLGRSRFKGGLIDLSILDGALALIAAPLVRSLSAPDREPDELWGTHACYRVYECADGRRLAMGALEPQFWQAVCEGLGFPEHVRSQWSRKKQPGIAADFEARFRTKPLADWMKILAPLDACVTPVQTLAEVIADPQVRAREGFLPQKTARGTFLSPTFLPQITRRSHRRRAPRHGEHTRGVLLSLGLSKARIQELRDTGVIQ
ncbi:MAG TPA: CaiB/BaiF CoA-transferase family protein [Vicinamibacteria bacterium]|nr:CaiB/BaiF CoA-transferase family protein [Vicinamibacteria bacterium]HRB11708.1 CaiB/BaiF CoA-transferase family protein [Vicinamibacteria bacterium]